MRNKLVDIFFDKPMASTFHMVQKSVQASFFGDEFLQLGEKKKGSRC
jgi:hypothetical protein